MVKKKTSALLDTLQKTTHEPAKGTPSKKMEANAPHGEKSDYIRASITLPPDIYEMVTDEAKSRRIAKQQGGTVSAIIREALVEYLGK